MEVVSNLHPPRFLAECSTQWQPTLKFRRTFSQITTSTNFEASCRKSAGIVGIKKAAVDESAPEADRCAPFL